MSNKQRMIAGLTGFVLALVVAVTSCMKVDITMPEGPRGADGLSAYEVWKAGVADGSIPWDKSATAIVDFFKFLKGKDGKDGKDGLNGMSAYDQWKELVAAGSVDDPHNQGEKWPTYATTIQDFWRFLTGATGEAGQTPHIGADGNWWIGDYNTNQPARGPKGADGKDGKDGTSPVVSIGTNGNWYINGIDTGMSSRGANGKDGRDGRDGRDGTDGTNGKDGRDGTNGSDDVSGHTIITIGENGNWFINGEDTGKPSRGVAGKDGRDGIDGKDGRDGIDGKDGRDGKDGINGKDGRDGIDGKDGRDGKDGIDGKDGRDGKDGIDGKDGRDGRDGKDGIDGKDGRDGRDGKDATGGTGTEINNNNDNDNTNNNTVSPTITISNDNTWVINGVDTGKPVVNGKDGRDGRDGKDGKDGRDGRDGKATVVTIGSNGHWYIDGNDTGVSAKGEKGADGKDAEAPVVTIDPVTGNWLINGTDTGRPSRGADGKTPTVTIGDNGNWFVDGKDTNKPARGADGKTPEVAIGENGNWFINGKDTGKPSYGKPGKDGKDGKDGVDGKSTYELWKDMVANGKIDDPKDPDKTWPTDKNTEADFFEYLCTYTCIACKEIEPEPQPEPKPTVELVNKTPGEEVDWKTGTTTFIVKDGDGNPIPGAKVSDLPGMPGKSYTAGPDGKITVPNADLPSIQDKKPRTGETTVTSNGSTQKSTPDTYVPNRVKVRYMPYDFMMTRSKIAPCVLDDTEYNHETGVYLKEPIGNRNEVDYYVTPERQLNPGDPWTKFPKAAEKELINQLRKQRLIPVRVTNPEDPSSIDTNPDHQVMSYKYDAYEVSYDGNALRIKISVRRHMLKNFRVLKNHQPHLYDVRDDVYFTFVPKDQDPQSGSILYGVTPELYATYQLPALQMAPGLKKLELVGRHEVTYNMTDGTTSKGYRFKKAYFTFDFSTIDWNHVYRLEANKPVMKNGNAIISFPRVPEKEAKSTGTVRCEMNEYNFGEARSKADRKFTTNTSEPAKSGINLGSFDRPLCVTNSTEELTKGEYREDPAVKSRIYIYGQERGTIDPNKFTYAWLRPYQYGELIEVNPTTYKIKWPFNLDFVTQPSVEIVYSDNDPHPDFNL